MFSSMSFRTALALGAFALSLTPLAARAQTSAHARSANVPCAAASSAMRASATMPEPQIAKTDVDGTYKAMMAEHAHAMMDISELERRCGSDAKMKSEAEASERAAHGVLNTLQVF